MALERGFRVSPGAAVRARVGTGLEGGAAVGARVGGLVELHEGAPKAPQVEQEAAWVVGWVGGVTAGVGAVVGWVGCLAAGVSPAVGAGLPVVGLVSSVSVVVALAALAALASVVAGG